MPERGGFADQLQDIVRRLDALERSARAPFTSIGVGNLSVEADGEITVGSTVVLDADGLAVNGRPVDGVKVVTASNTGGGTPTSLTSSAATLLTATVSVPAWVSSASVFAVCGLTAFGLSVPLDGRAIISTRIGGESGNATTVDMAPGGEYRFAGTGHTRTIASPGSSIDVDLRGLQQLFSGSGIETSSFFVNAIAVLS
jgi:hypothetical protein